MITVEVNAFREALKKVGVAVAKRTPLPVTSSVLLETKGVEMTIKSTNLERGVTVTLPCGSGADISVCIPFKVLNQFVSVGDGQLSLDCQGKALFVSRPTIGKMTIGVMDGKEFPPVPQPKAEAVWNKLDAKEVCRLFGIVALGCAGEESRPVLTAVCCRDGEIASADGFRLYNAKSTKFNFGIGRELNETPMNKLIPRETMLKIIALFGKTVEMEVAWGDCKVQGDYNVFFKSGGCTLVSQLVQGTYPKWEQLIPVSFNGKVSFSVPIMVQRLKMMEAVKETNNAVKLLLTQENNTDICYLRSTRCGDLDEPEFDMTMPCKIEAYGKVAVQHNYLLEAIKPFSMCAIELTNPTSPMKITGDIEGLAVVVMPYFVQWE